MKKNVFVLFLFMSIATVPTFGWEIPDFVPPGICLIIPSEPLSNDSGTTIPLEESFDEYPEDFTFGTTTNGWYMNEGDASHVVNCSTLLGDNISFSQNSTFSGNCLYVATEGQMLLNTTTGVCENLWIDLSVLMTPTIDTPYFDTPPQLAIYVNADSKLSVYSGITNDFLESTNPIVSASNKTFRLTIQIAYGEQLSVPFFRVSVDGEPITWVKGAFLPGETNSVNGSWLPCATTNHTFYGIGFYGEGYLDSVHLCDTYLGGEPSVSPNIEVISQQVAIKWLSDYGRFYKIESCDNLTSNVWQLLESHISGAGTTNLFLDNINNHKQMFYRISPID